MELVIFVSSIVISAILIMIRGELKDIGESLHKIGEYLDRINKKDGSWQTDRIERRNYAVDLSARSQLSYPLLGQLAHSIP